MKYNAQPRINRVAALASVAVGIIACFASQYLYTAYRGTVPTPVLIGLLCLLLFVLLFVAVWVSSAVTGSFDQNSILYHGRKQMIGYFLLGTLAIFFLSTSLEFLYELTPKRQEIAATSYIFILDESGSMRSNDPSGLRYQAIPEIMKAEEPDFPYMVYTFSDTARMVREMEPFDPSDDAISITSDGGTAIFGTILQVLNDYKNGVWDGGPHPKVIFLTDGSATDLSRGFLFFRGNMPEFNAALEEYSRLGINISTVGLGSADRAIMTQMAETTGGVFVNIQDAADLAVAMKAAATSYSDRDLLSIRYMSHLNALYGVLRVLFLTIIGSTIGSLLLFAYMEDSSIPLLVSSSILSAFVGSFLLEIGLKAGIPQSALWFILWALFSLTLGLIFPGSVFRLLPVEMKDCELAPGVYKF